jgi:hypothetical protein
MSTFLEIAQMAARESGTISGTLPTAVTGQTGRLLKFVNWVQIAWTKIQNERAGWLWMQGEFEATTTASTARYTSSSFSLSRLATWPKEGMTLYRQSLGRADEGALPFIDWTRFKRSYDVGVPVEGKPVHYSISPANEICFGPVPDATYVVRGPYRKTPQALAANGDIPEMPLRFHDLIAWYANMLMAETDEAELHIAVNARRYRDLRGDLERDQLEEFDFIGEPLA